MARKELTKDELEIHKNAIASNIKKDFIKKDISYQNAAEMKFLAGYRRQTASTQSEVRTILRTDFNASIVAVGDGQVAIVKRREQT